MIHSRANLAGKQRKTKKKKKGKKRKQRENAAYSDASTLRARNKTTLKSGTVVNT